MNTKDLHLFDTPNWGIIITTLGVVLAVVGIIIALYFSKRKLIDIVTIENTAFLKDTDLNFLPFDSDLIEMSDKNIFEIEMLISNLGNHCFRSEEFQSHITIELVDKNATFLDCQTYSNNKYTKALFGLSKNKIKATKFDEFEKGNYILLKIKYIANQPTSGKVSAKIRGMREINEKIDSTYPRNDDGYLRSKYSKDIMYGIIVFLSQLYLYYFLFKVSFSKNDSFMLDYIKTYSWKVLFKSETIYLLIYFSFALLISIQVMKFLHKFFYPFKWVIRDTSWIKV